MQNPFKSKSKTNATADKAVQDAERQLDEKSKALETAEAEFDKAQTQLDKAYAGEADSATVLKLEKERDNAKAKRDRAQQAYDAVAKKLEQAKQDAHDAEHQQQRQTLDDTLKQRAALAKKLAANASERAGLFKQFTEADEQIHAARNQGLVSEHAVAGHNYGPAHLEHLLNLEDGRVGLPGKLTAWTERGPEAYRSTLVEAVEKDNATIKPTGE